jgi:hypothetical protein
MGNPTRAKALAPLRGRQFRFHLSRFHIDNEISFGIRRRTNTTEQYIASNLVTFDSRPDNNSRVRVNDYESPRPESANEIAPRQWYLIVAAGQQQAAHKEDHGKKHTTRSSQNEPPVFH